MKQSEINSGADEIKFKYKNQIKFIRSLSLKKNRQKHGLFIVEGEKLVNEVLSSDWEVEGIYATKEWLGENAIIISNNDFFEKQEIGSFCTCGAQTFFVILFFLFFLFFNFLVFFVRFTIPIL